MKVIGEAVAACLVYATGFAGILWDTRLLMMSVVICVAMLYANTRSTPR